jgi:hypothetical protein
VGARLICFLMKEKAHLRFCIGGGELFCMGDDGGLDRGASSDQTAGEVFGLDVGGSEDSQRDSVPLAIIFGTRVLVMLVSESSVGRSTRRRLVGGSSSWSGRF